MSTTEERLAAVEERLEKVETLIKKASETFSRLRESPVAKQMLGALGVKLP